MQDTPIMSNSDFGIAMAKHYKLLKHDWSDGYNHDLADFVWTMCENGMERAYIYNTISEMARGMFD